MSSYAVSTLIEQMNQLPLTEDLVSPLHLAAAGGNSEMVGLLLSQYSPQPLIDLKDRNGETALHWAARKGHLEVVQLLLERGASRRTNNQKGENPFEIALKKEQDDVAQLILFYPSNISEDPGQKELFSLVKLAHDCLKGKRPDSWLPEYLYEKPNFWVAALLLNIACLNAKKISLLCEDLLLHQLEQLEGSFVEHEVGRPPSHPSHVRDYRNRIREIRQRVAQSLEQKFPVPIDTVLLEQTQDYKEFIADLLNECIAIKGEAPPTRFAMVGLGSMSRNEMCPYSDIEFIFLIEEDNEDIRSYFRSITRLISLKIVNLGETNYSLPGGYSDKIDSTPSGFKMDSTLSPLGQRGLYEESGDELIGTPQHLADFQADESKVIIIRNAMSTSCLIAGEPALLRAYQEQVSLNLSSKVHGSEQTQGERLALKLIEDDVIEFAPRLTQEKIDGRAFGIKQELYRLPQSLINALCLYYGVRGANAFQRIDRLRDQGVFSITGANQLKRVFRSTLKMRVKAHLFYREEKEILYYARSEDDAEAAGLFIITPELTKELTELYRILIPLHQKAQIFLSEDRDAFAGYSFYNADVGNYNDQLRKSFQFKDSLQSAVSFAALDPNSPSALSALAVAQTDIGQLNKAVRQLKAALSFSLKKHNDYSDPEVILLLGNLGVAYLKAGKTDKALKYAELFMSSRPSEPERYTGSFGIEIGHIYMSLGNAYLDLGDIDRALQNLHSALFMFRTIHSDNFSGIIRPHSDTLAALNNLGKAYSITGDTHEALKHFESSLEMARELYPNQFHPTLATVLANMGHAHMMLGESDPAINYLNSALLMQKEIYNDDPHPDIANTLYLLGLAYERANKTAEAINQLILSLEIHRKISDKSFEPRQAMILKDLGKYHGRLGNYRESNNYFNLSLSFYSKFDTKDTLKTAAIILSDIAANHASLKEYRTAVEYFERSISTYKQANDSEAEPQFAKLLMGLGCSYLGVNNPSKAIVFFEDAHRIYSQTFGLDHPDTKRANSAIQIARF